MMSSVLEAIRRPLTDAERRVIGAKIRSLQARRRRSRQMATPITVGIVLVLWLWTMLASDAPWTVVTLFWLVVGAGILLWARRETRRDAGPMANVAAGLQSALKCNAADVYDVRARAFATFEEIEDEGACYAFELESNRLVFIAGQEFYESARFPSLDFSLVYVVDEDGQTVDLMIEKRGAKAAPATKIPAALKRRLEIPEHLEVRRGALDDLEAICGLPTT
jgi:hypothetical protein